MSLVPGLYIIHDPGAGRVLDCYGGGSRIGTWWQNNSESQKWHVKYYPGNLRFAIQSVLNQKYIPTGMDGPDMQSIDEGNSAIFHLERQFQDFYLIKLAETNLYFCHLNIKPRQDERYTPTNFTGGGGLRSIISFGNSRGLGTFPVAYIRSVTFYAVALVMMLVMPSHQEPILLFLPLRPPNPNPLYSFFPRLWSFIS
ncbi:hypothetical protein B0J17DRAFT_707383 [Rhizoctonia solani]|nr:hypothetical protein B0J17DRAFT_707383 [Rhizoctonia solani]